jgi:hypothetical protein
MECLIINKDRIGPQVASYQDGQEQRALAPNRVETTMAGAAGPAMEDVGSANGFRYDVMPAVWKPSACIAP